MIEGQVSNSGKWLFGNALLKIKKSNALIGFMAILGGLISQT
jgi:hypothetical protein